MNGKPFHEKPERQLKLAEGATFPCMPEADKVRDAVLFAFAEAGVPEERAEKMAEAVRRRFDLVLCGPDALPVFRPGGRSG